MKIKHIGFAAVLVLTTALLAGCGEPAAPAAPGKYAAVAKCLTEKGVIMYGAYWCPHCASQKTFFGPDFQFATYQECDDAGKNGNHKLCLDKGVVSYPTWIFPGQGAIVGETPVAGLAKIANCEDLLPEEDKELLKTLTVKTPAQEEAAATPTLTTNNPDVSITPTK